MIDSPLQPIPTRREPKPWNVAFVVLIVTVFSFGLVAQMIGLVIAWTMYGGGFMEFSADMTHLADHPDLKTPLLVAQAISTVLGLAIIPPLFWWSMRRKSIMTFFTETKLQPRDLLYAFGIMLFFLALNSAVIEWNTSLEYPGAFGRFAREMEDKAEELVKFMADFKTFGDYLVAVVVIAVFASIGEELVFRGLLQTELQKAFKNPHIAIWVTAMFFSAFHLQFYGFFPRFLLGGVLGYLYYWSRNLAVPIFAHFINNFIAVSAIYFAVEKVDEPMASPPWYVIVISTIIGGFLMYRFYTLHKKVDETPPPNDQPA